MILQVGVKALLKNKEGNYLLLKRSEAKYSIKDGWDIPGGRINPGESLIENLRREVREETKLDLIYEPLLIAAQDIFVKEEKHVVRLTYTGQIDGEPKLDSEHVDYKWLTLDELKKQDGLDKYLKVVLEEYKDQIAGNCR